MQMPHSTMPHDWVKHRIKLFLARTVMLETLHISVNRIRVCAGGAVAAVFSRSINRSKLSTQQNSKFSYHSPKAFCKVSFSAWCGKSLKQFGEVFGILLLIRCCFCCSIRIILDRCFHFFRSHPKMKTFGHKGNMERLMRNHRHCCSRSAEHPLLLKVIANGILWI